MIYFQESNGVKKRGDTELECKTSVKHNSKFKNIHFQKLSFICWRKNKEVNKRNRKKTSGHFNTKGFFLFENVEKRETGGAKGDNKSKEKTKKQLEQDGKWNKKNMCSKNKNKRKEKNTHKEDKVKKKKRRRTNEKMQRRRQKTRGDKQEDFSLKKRRRRKKRKIKVRQKEEFQKEATKNFILKEKMKKFAKRGNLFFHQTI